MTNYNSTPTLHNNDSKNYTNKVLGLRETTKCVKLSNIYRSLDEILNQKKSPIYHQNKILDLNSEGIGFRDRNWECGLYINESLGIYDLLNESRKNWDF